VVMSVIDHQRDYWRDQHQQCDQYQQHDQYQFLFERKPFSVESVKRHP